MTDTIKTTVYVTIFEAPKPRIIECTKQNDWYHHKSENGGMTMFSMEYAQARKEFPTKEEAQAYIDTEGDKWLKSKEGIEEVQKHDLREIAKSIKLNDGIYTVPQTVAYKEMQGSLDRIIENKETRNILLSFINKYPNTQIAHAYETATTILLTDKVHKFNGTMISEGFNYGGNTLIENCPKTILIIAQND